MSGEYNWKVEQVEVKIEKGWRMTDTMNMSSIVASVSWIMSKLRNVPVAILNLWSFHKSSEKRREAGFVQSSSINVGNTELLIVSYERTSKFRKITKLFVEKISRLTGTEASKAGVTKIGNQSQGGSPSWKLNRRPTNLLSSSHEVTTTIGQSSPITSAKNSILFEWRT
ncbi:hypothetical protein BT69DRAFT_1297393 [Atractiella rhizophila]|nr:hypothetical protein BT69DRAFT_1297393 [Atractiella rhizophila]